jgi:glutamyl-tRNA synthetase
VAAARARAAGGSLWLRNDDLDAARCREEFAAAMIEDLRWLGLAWREPVVTQSGRIALYREALGRLRAAGAIYPCNRSRRDVAEAAGAPHEGLAGMAEVAGGAGGAGVAGGVGDEPVFPKAWRPAADAVAPELPVAGVAIETNWRFRVPDGEELFFNDSALGPMRAVAGRDFGDFIVWRRDNVPGYQLACAVDDAALGITEVVRGADLVMSTFRQLLVLRALGAAAPGYFHCPLMNDEQGRRLAKRHDALALRTLRARGMTPAEIVRGFAGVV